MANRIRELREARGLSQDELATRMQPPTTFQQISRLEKGGRRLSERWARPIAKVLNVEVGDLFAPEPGEPGATTERGHFVKDPTQIRLLKLWEEIDDETRLNWVLSLGERAAKIIKGDDGPLHRKPRRRR